MFTAIATDVGIKKKINQDSIVAYTGSFCGEPFGVAAVCDGMGGLAKGEVASAMLVRAISGWVAESLPELLSLDKMNRAFEKTVDDMIREVDVQIKEYSASLGHSCGSTIVLLLCYEGLFHAVNVGDSRIYRIRKNVLQITKDQTFVQREIDRGHLTQEEAEHHPKRSVLLQCVGAGEILNPEYIHGKYRQNDVFLVCCDGFRHEMTSDEFYSRFTGRNVAGRAIAEKALTEAIETIKNRGERDNISAVILGV